MKEKYGREFWDPNKIDESECKILINHEIRIILEEEDMIKFRKVRWFRHTSEAEKSTLGEKGLNMKEKGITTNRKNML